MKNTCETKSDEGECGKLAKYKVTARWNEKISFLVCKDCIPAYQYIQGKEYGNTQGNFIIEKLDDALNVLDEVKNVN